MVTPSLLNGLFHSPLGRAAFLGGNRQVLLAASDDIFDCVGEAGHGDTLSDSMAKSMQAVDN